MEKQDIGFIFLYIAAFGFSDYIVECMKLEGIWYILFYTMLLVIGLILVSRPMKNDNTSDDM